ncbi:MAG: hypothetical protein ACR2P8_04800 [Myxococcota bacterium]
MEPIRKIAILIHENERAGLKREFIAAALSEQWQAMGIEVEVARGIDRAVEADLWLPHVDLTVIPPDYRRFLAECPRVVNREVVDISKRRISDLIVEPGDGYRGPVIVKSNENFGGRPERRLLGEHRAGRTRPWRRRLARLRGRLGLGSGFDPWARIDPRHYPIFDSPDALPKGTFENPELVVERFVPERQGELYVLRSYAFAGDETINVRIAAKGPVVKAPDSVEREEVPVPEALRTVRARLAIDYGKLDYVIHDGQVRLLDVNRTPTFARHEQYSEYQRRTAERFARGLIELFEEPPSSERH